MDPEQIARQFHEDGSIIVPGVFARSEIAEIEQQLGGVIRDAVPTLKPGRVYYEDVPGRPIKSIFRLEEFSPFFSRLMADERLLRIMRAIFPYTDVIQVGTSLFAKAARAGSVTPPHQDNAFQNLRPPEDLICTIAVDESTPENGALIVQKGSHKLGLQPHRPSGVMGFSQTLVNPVDTRRYPEVLLCMRPGDICLHHTNAVHRSDANTTDQSRRQLAIGYRSARAKRDEAGWAKYQVELRKLHQRHATATTNETANAS
jgi:ectoine hydroxylase-related dioxygenase (phytanoyl-CoA dioxygenase family)